MDASVIVGVTSGLGNQMFQYAAGRALSLRLGLPLLLDLSWYRGGEGYTPREYGLGVFDLPAKLANDEQLRAASNGEFDRRFGLVPVSELFTVVQEQNYWPGFHDLTGPTYLRGWWQSARYFSGVGRVIRQDFAFPEFTSTRAREMAAAIGSHKNSVAVHIRRGDHVSHPVVAQRWGAVCTPEYYSAAIDRMAKTIGPLKLFLFSEDPLWVRANFNVRGHDAAIVDVPEHLSEPHQDIHLMSLARHHVIANSTFSWWAAWLARWQEQVVVAPSRWTTVAKAVTRYGTRDRYPKTWIRM